MVIRIVTGHLIFIGMTFLLNSYDLRFLRLLRNAPVWVTFLVLLSKTMDFKYEIHLNS